MRGKRVAAIGLAVIAGIVIVAVGGLLLWQWREGRVELLTVGANGKLKANVGTEAVESVYLMRRTRDWKQERLRAPQGLAGRVLEALATGRRLGSEIPAAATSGRGVVLVFKDGRELCLEGDHDYWMSWGGIARRYPWNEPSAMMLECPALEKVVGEAFSSAGIGAR